MSKAPAARFFTTGPSPCRPLLVKCMPTPLGDAWPSASPGPCTTDCRWRQILPSGSV